MGKQKPKKWIQEVLTPDDAELGIELEADRSYILQAGHLVGRVEVELLDEDEREVRAGVSYTLRSLDPDRPQTWQGETDAEGVLKHEGLPFGGYELEVQGQTVGVPVLWPEEPAWPVRLLDADDGWEDGTFLSARFLDASGQVPLANASAQVGGQTLTTDEEGVLRLEAEGGAIDVVFSGGTVQVTPGKVGELEEVALPFHELSEAERECWRRAHDDA